MKKIALLLLVGCLFAGVVASAQSDKFDPGGKFANDPDALPIEISKKRLRCVILKKQFEHVVEMFRNAPKSRQTVAFREAQFAVATALAVDAINAGCW